jgi:flagellar hook-associated protein 3 FlgL
MPTNRVTDKIMSTKAHESMAKARNRVIDNHEQASSGLRINKPSDDPSGTIRATNLKVQKAKDEKVSQNMEWATSLLNVTDASLGELTDVLSRAKELAIQLSSSTNQSDDTRHAASGEVEQLTLRCVQIGNTRLGDRYVFAGFQTDRAPFDADGNYFGDAGITELEIDRSQKLPLNVPGLMPFYGVSEITKEMQETRNSPQENGKPTIQGEMRNPASITAENRGLDIEDVEDEGVADIQRNAGVNLFNVMKSFVAGLKNGDKDLINGAIDGLDGALRQVISSRAVIGSRQSVMRLGQQNLEAGQESTQTLLSSVQDADTIKVFHELSKNENLLNVSMETSKKLLSRSLMDFLK